MMVPVKKTPLGERSAQARPRNARIGDIFQLGPRRTICGDTTDPAVLARLLEGDAPTRVVLTN